MIDYKLLEALAAVVEEQGFEKAARKLGLTQSAISQRIRQFEEYCGQILLIRSSPPEATAAGNLLISHFNKVKLLEDDLQISTQRRSRSAYSTIRIAINNDSLATWFTPATADVLVEENILLNISVDDQEQTQNLLRQGSVICSISTYNRPINGCSLYKLGEMAYGMYCAADVKDSWFPDGFNLPDANKHPSIRFNTKDFINSQFFQRCFQSEALEGPAVFVPSSEQFIEWIRRGLCYGSAPLLQCRELVETGILADLLPEIKINIPLYFHCWNIKSSKLKKFSEELLAKSTEFIY